MELKFKENSMGCLKQVLAIDIEGFPTTWNISGSCIVHQIGLFLRGYDPSFYSIVRDHEN